MATRLRYEYKNGYDISVTGISSERESDKDVILDGRLESVLRRINPEVNRDAIKQAIHKLTIEKSPNLLENNLTFHEYLINGIEVEHYDEEGKSIVDIVYIIDFKQPQNNDFLAVNQLTVVNGDFTKRPDIILFINGLPIVVIELKSSFK